MSRDSTAQRVLCVAKDLGQDQGCKCAHQEGEAATDAWRDANDGQRGWQGAARHGAVRLANVHSSPSRRNKTARRSPGHQRQNSKACERQKQLVFR
eukprot:scaffold3795_cov126-Isochrysis_galbana.AAC.24